MTSMQLASFDVSPSETNRFYIRFQALIQQRKGGTGV